MTKSIRGFTIVELLIVIVVIGVLATITIVSYNGISARARDSQRLQDIKTIVKALEIYYADNGRFPNSICGSGGAPACPSPKKINNSWATTADGSWSVLEAALVPEYLSSLPKDPKGTTSDDAAIYSGYNYDYVYWVGGGCDPGNNQAFRINYNLEATPVKRELVGDCVDPSGNPVVYSNSSQYITIKG